jgi:hypothetical protein
MDNRTQEDIQKEIERSEWERFCRLGEMIGDGLHHEEPWISKEYKRLMLKLNPDIKKVLQEQRKVKANRIQEQMEKLMKEIPCKECGGELYQKRKGTKICYCRNCNGRFKATSKKKN